MIPDTEPSNIFPTNTSKPLPYATASLVLGILSIVFCWTYGVIGLTLGIVGLVLANKDRRLYQSNPEAYSAESYKSSNAGRICAIVGLILSSLLFLFIVGMVIFALTTVPFIH